MTGTLVRDTTTVFNRELQPVLRNPVSLMFTIVQPLFFLALFSPLLPDTVNGHSALQWFVPGVVVMACLFGTSTTGSNLQLEMQTGAHERMLVSPLSRPSLLIGRALKEVVPMLGQTALIVLATVPFGFDLHPLGVVLGLLLLAVFCVGLGALSYALALVSAGQEWMFWVVQQTLLFPLLLIAGILLPIENGPGWLRALSHVNPLTYVVNAERVMFNGELASTTVAGGLLAAVLVCAVGLGVGVRTMSRDLQS